MKENDAQVHEVAAYTMRDLGFRGGLVLTLDHEVERK